MAGTVNKPMPKSRMEDISLLLVYTFILPIAIAFCPRGIHSHEKYKHKDHKKDTNSSRGLGQQKERRYMNVGPTLTMNP